jgi:DNA-binding IscR family transcriptional regulator
LLAIYRAVDEDRIFALHRQPPSATCPVGKDIQPALTEVIDRAEGALQRELGQTTLADLMSALRAPSRDAYRRAGADRNAAPASAASAGS